MSCAAVNWPFRLRVSISLDTAALTWLSVPYGPLLRSCLGSPNAWSAPVVPEKRRRIRAPDADLGYVSLVAHCMCLVRVRGMSRVHRWSRRNRREVGAPDADSVIRPLRLVAYALSGFAECPEYTGGPGKVAGRATEAQSPEMGEGWPHWSSR